jgi:hypothetical protein
MDQVAYHAAYVNRPGSVDLGIKSLEGCGPPMHTSWAATSPSWEPAAMRCSSTTA